MKIREIVHFLVSKVEIVKKVGNTLETLYFGYIYEAQVIRFGDLEIYIWYQVVVKRTLLTQMIDMKQSFIMFHTYN